MANPLGNLFEHGKSAPVGDVLDKKIADIGPLESLINKYTGNGLTRGELEQNRFNERMAAEAYNREIEFYERFQSPKAVMQQYQDAGINPALVAGYSPNTPPSSAAASGNGGNSSMDIVGLIANLIMQNRQLDIQSSVAAAQVNDLNASASLKDAQAQNYGVNTQLSEVALEIAKATKEDNVQMVHEKLNKLKNDVAISGNEVVISTHRMSTEFFQSLITELDYDYQAATYTDRVNLAKYVTQYQDALARGADTEAKNAQRKIDAMIAQMHADAYLKRLTGAELEEKIRAFYLNDPSVPNSLFERTTSAQWEYLKSNTYFNYASGQYEVKKSEMVDKDLEFYWKNYVNFALGIKREVFTGGKEILNAAAHVAPALIP